MFVTHWLGRLRFRNSSPRTRARHPRARSRVGPLAFVESLESRTLLSAPPVIASFDLYNDTGTPGDYVTNDAQVTGTVTNDNGVSDLTVQFDWTGDGEPDGSTTTDSDGMFLFDASTEVFYGEVTIRARSGEIDYSTWMMVYGDWVSLTFTFHNEPAQVTAFGLLNNVGSAEYPKTVDGLVTGTVANPDGGVSGLNVEFDYDGDGMADDYTLTDDQAIFTYDVGAIVGFGEHTIYARVNESNRAGEVLGAWVELSFEFIAPPWITSFMAQYIGDHEWRLEGTVDYYAPSSLTVRFGGLAEGNQAYVQSDGSFSILLTIYDSGTVTAQTTDEYGRNSNVAEDYVMNV